MEFEQYTNLYDAILTKTGDKDVTLAIMNHVAKDKRTAEINGAKGIAPPVPRKQRMDPNGPPTLNQKGWLVAHGIPVPATAGEASMLIDKAKGK